MYVESVPNPGSPPAILLREFYRADGKVRKRTLLNLSGSSTADSGYVSWIKELEGAVRALALRRRRFWRCGGRAAARIGPVAARQRERMQDGAAPSGRCCARRAVLLGLGFDQPLQIVHDVGPFEDVPGRCQPILPFLAQHRREKGAEHGATDSGVVFANDRRVARHCGTEGHSGA